MAQKPKHRETWGLELAGPLPPRTARQAKGISPSIEIVPDDYERPDERDSYRLADCLRDRMLILREALDEVGQRTPESCNLWGAVAYMRICRKFLADFLRRLPQEYRRDADGVCQMVFELGERTERARWIVHGAAATHGIRIHAGPHSPYPPAFRAKWGRRARRVYEQTLAKTRSKRLAGKARNALLLSAEMSRDMDNMKARRRSEYRRKYPSATPEKVAAEAGKVSRPSWQALKAWSEDAPK